MSEEDYRHIFVKNLSYYMNMHGKNQMDLMNDLNLSSSTVSSWCTGKKLPRMGKIQMLADYFGIEKSDLIEEKNHKQPENLLSSKDERDIAKDLDSIMDKLQSGDKGPASYNGEELSPEASELFREELEIALKRLKIINKEKYTPKKYKK